MHGAQDGAVIGGVLGADAHPALRQIEAVRGAADHHHVERVRGPALAAADQEIAAARPAVGADLSKTAAAAREEHHRGARVSAPDGVDRNLDARPRVDAPQAAGRRGVLGLRARQRQGENAGQQQASAQGAEVMEAVHKNIVVPEGYSIRYFGEKESQDESNEALAANLPLTFFLIFVTLLLLFRTYRKPVVIILMLPLIFIGVVLGLVVMGKTLDFFAILGVLGLIGMNIKNSIVLIDQIGLEVAQGVEPYKAVIIATTSRIVPVAMASGTTILGMLPLLFDAMFGGMAATIMGGLLVASALTLFVLPVAYCSIHHIYESNTKE